MIVLSSVDGLTKGTYSLSSINTWDDVDVSVSRFNTASRKIKPGDATGLQQIYGGGGSINLIKRGAIITSEENVGNIRSIFYIMYLKFALLIPTFYFKKIIQILILRYPILLIWFYSIPLFIDDW